MMLSDFNILTSLHEDSPQFAVQYIHAHLVLNRAVVNIRFVFASWLNSGPNSYLLIYLYLFIAIN